MTAPQDSRALLAEARKKTHDYFLLVGEDACEPAGDDIRSLCDALEAALKDRDEALEVIRDFSWIDDADSSGYFYFCPSCGASVFASRRQPPPPPQHAKKCDLAAFLARHPQQAKEAP